MGRHRKLVTLSEEEQAQLVAINKKGVHSARKISRAKALLLMHEGKTEEEIRTALSIDRNNYFKIKQRYFAGGINAALEELPRSGQPRKVTARIEAQITSLACSDAPDGSSCWTLSLINEKLVELNYVSSISNESIRQVLKKVNLNLGRSKCGVSAQ